MKRIDLTQKNGMPLDQDTLNFIQDGYSDPLKELGALLGKYIILNGTSATGGWVAIDGKIMPFDAGIGNDCYIRTTKESVIFRDGETKAIYSTDKLVFGVGTPQLNWNDFKVITPLIDLQIRLEQLERKNAIFQTGGGMVLWNKPANQIPPGWREVANWQGRMPIGAGNLYSPSTGWSQFNDVGAMGGDPQHKIIANELPAHSHNYQDSYMLETKNYGGVSGVETLSNVYNGSHAVSGNKRYLHYKNGTTTSTGASQSINIMNPFRVVLFIEYVG